ncbi:MAG: hypothetical protein WEB19_02615 [Acidimicrobiia bacterium]
MSRARRIVFVITLAAAAYLVAVPFALSLFSRTSDAETLSDYYRPLMSEEGIRYQRNNLRVVNAAGDEVPTVFLPRLQTELGMDEAQFNAYVADNFPHVAAFLKRAPEVVAYLNPGLEKVLAQGDNFEDADQFPLANLDVRVGPWSLLLLGLGLVVIAVLVRVGTSPVPVVAVFVVGLGLVVGPPVLGWFHQTEAAEQVAEAARGPFTSGLANTTVDDTYKFDAAITEIREAMFPAIGRRLGLSDPELDTFLHDSFPDTMRFLDAWRDNVYRTSRALTLSLIEYMDEFHNADATPYEALPWVFIAPGAVLLLTGAFGLLSARRRAAAPAQRS